MEREMRRRIRLEEEEEEEEEEDLMCKLPEGIAAEIFSRLSYTNILECFGVKRSWTEMLNQMAATSDFRQKHLAHRLKQDGDAATGYLLLMKITKKSKYLETHLAEYVTDYTYQVNQIPCPVMPSSTRSINPSTGSMDYKMIVGSCNGLICLCQRITDTTVDLDPVFIYNPLLKECLDLPGILNYSDENYLTNKTTTVAMGFGFHPTTKKYKVVRIFYREAIAAIGEVEIYTLGLGDGEWKSKGSIPYQLQGTRPGVLVNGFLYWLIERENQPVMIVSLDLETEVFQVVQPPPELPIPNPDIWTHFKEFGGYLTLAHVDQGGEEMKFWMLDNNNNNNNNWNTIEFTVDSKMEFSYYQPYAFRKDLSEVLFACNPVEREEVLAFYVWSTRNLIQVVRMEGERVHDVVPHTKSYVSMKAMGEKDARRMT